MGFPGKVKFFYFGPDLFEIVDRRAKLVASELSEEQSDSQPQASNVQGSSEEKTKPRTKAQKRLSTKKYLKTSDTVRKEASSEILQSDVTPGKENGTFPSDNEGSSSANSMVQTSNELYSNSEKDTPKIPSFEPLDADVVKHGVDQEVVSAIVSNAEASLSTSNGEFFNENASDVYVEHPPSSFAAKDIEVFSEDHLTDGGQDTKSQTADVPSKTEQEKSEHAQGLLKTTNSTGQSKDARLAWVCAGLSSRLQEYKSENAQLEELLIVERELSKSYEARIKQLQQDLFVSKSEVTRIESNMVEALAAKNSEIEALVNSMEALKKQAAVSEGNLASLQALREELSSAERRAEEERATHNATKMTAMEREVELE
ncbi:hypothetical protein GQ457_10G016980 [Hibiscus cannabinus]